MLYTQCGKDTYFSWSRLQAFRQEKTNKKIRQQKKNKKKKKGIQEKVEEKEEEIHLN